MSVEVNQSIPDPLVDQPDFSVPPAVEAEIEEWITHYPRKRSASLMVLHALQERFGYLSRQAVEWTAVKLELQPINVLELVTFYPMFQTRPTGQHHLRVCRTLSCALGGSKELHAHLCGKLGLDLQTHGPQTTGDGKFTVEFVECLAGCGTAPVMMCDGAMHEGVSLERASDLLERCRK